MKTNNKMNGITLLRGLAASLVLVVHSFLLLGYAQPYSKNFELTNIGVDIFFILSGFIMVLAHWNDFGDRTNSTKKFLKKRLIRIYPMYFLATTLTAAILYASPKLFHSMEFSELLLIQSLLFLPSQIGTSTSLILAVAWTLVFEVTFYLIFSLCLFFTRRIGLGIAILSLLIWAIAGATLTTNNHILNFLLSTLPIEFIIGIVICIYFKSSHYKPLKNPAIIIAALSIAWMIIFKLADAYPLFDRTLRDNNRIIYYGIPATIIFLCFLGANTIKNDQIRSVINLVGDASYSTYLTHFLTIGAIKYSTIKLGIIESTNIYVLVFFSCLLCTLCGIAVHKIIETPATKLIIYILSKNRLNTPAIKPN